ncbi:MAG TPA: type II toxin-antitoxin system Phd/YefM family antitoxin [Thermoanaerobaculia bacterium]|nr:type II toxin-antitoxin system Phd/YefM family antitoxin [Thermoanaerobaculia bacterium]
MRFKASKLRENLCRILDQVLKTGDRRGKLLKIVCGEPPSKLDRLEPHPDYLLTAPDDLVHLDWPEEPHS